MVNQLSTSSVSSGNGDLKAKFTTIPTELKRYRHWVNFRIVEREGNSTKIPFQPNGEPADSTDSITWTDYDSVIKALNYDHFSGIGFVVTDVDPYTGIDLDHCRNLETGEIDPKKLEWIKQFNSYTEITPSGGGVRIWCKGKLPADSRKKNVQLNVEIYSRERFFTVTGQHLEGTPTTIENRQEQLNTLYKEVFPEPEKKEPPRLKTTVNLDDQELIEKAKAAHNGIKFSKLWNGDTSEYNNDDSSADMALCILLAFWTGNDATRIDTLFRQSGLYREKWERQDYREITIQNAISKNHDIYKGNSPTPSCVNKNTNYNNTHSFTRNDFKVGQIRDKSGTNSGQISENENHQKLSVSFDEVLKEAGRMSKRDIAGTIGVQVTNDSFRKLVNRRLKDKQIRFYRGSSETLEWVNRDYKVLSIDDYRKQANLNITLPLGLSNLVNIPPGSVIGVAGYTSAGKTAVLLEIANQNISTQDLPIYYWFNEMSEDRMLIRLEDYPNLVKQMGKKFKAIKQTDFEFYDVVEPDGINLLDYIDMDGQGDQATYMIGSVIKKLQQPLGKGSIFYAVQKKANELFGYGGPFSAKLSNLYVSLDTIGQKDKSMLGRCKIAKAKDWDKINPVGLYCEYYTGGKHGRIFSDNIWKRNESDKGSTYRIGSQELPDCPNCKANHWDRTETGALKCIDCGYLEAANE